MLILLCDFLVVNRGISEILNEQMFTEWSISWLEIGCIVNFIYFSLEFFRIKIDNSPIASTGLELLQTEWV